jgi:uncharacterized protein (DUF433 family)
MTEIRHFTAAEAAFVLREPLRAVKKALDAGPVRPTLLQRGGAPVRMIGRSDLFYLYAMRSLRDELTPRGRLAFYEALQRDPGAPSAEVRVGRLKVAVADLIDEVDKRTAELDGLLGKLEFASDGEPLLKGSRVEVHRLAALLQGGMTIGEVQADYPSLTREDIVTARDYAEAHPKPGRPYPKSTVKRAVAGAGLEALDDVMGDADPAAA